MGNSKVIWFFVPHFWHPNKLILQPLEASNMSFAEIIQATKNICCPGCFSTRGDFIFFAEKSGNVILFGGWSCSHFARVDAALPGLCDRRSHDARRVRWWKTIANAEDLGKKWWKYYISLKSLFVFLFFYHRQGRTHYQKLYTIYSVA